MPEQESIKKPAWSLDVKIISHVADMLDIAGDYAIQLEMGNGNALFPLKANLYEVYLRLGGELEETQGNMLDPNARDDLRKYFKELGEWETDNIRVNIEKQQIDPTAFLKLRDTLRLIRGILYSELNRLFVKFITIYTEKEKTNRYSQRTG